LTHVTFHPREFYVESRLNFASSIDKENTIEVTAIYNIKDLAMR